MRLIESLKKRKFILFNIFLSTYIGVNLVGGERGLISYYEKNKDTKNLISVEINLSEILMKLKKIKLLSTNIDLITLIQFIEKSLSLEKKMKL